MGLLELILIIAVVGAVVYAVTKFIPMPEPFKFAIYAISAIILILFVIRAFGLDIPIARLR
jgi:hypothetical protein